MITPPLTANYKDINPETLAPEQGLRSHAAQRIAQPLSVDINRAEINFTNCSGYHEMCITTLLEIKCR